MKIVAKPIDVVAVFAGHKKPVPYKFKYYEDSGERIAVSVDRIQCVEESRLAGIHAFIYTCQSEICGIEKIYQLKYIIEQCRWELYKE